MDVTNEFSAREVSVITEQFEHKRSILTSKLNNVVKNSKKNPIWQAITAAVNAVGTAKRTTQDVKEKWRNLAANARKQLSEYRRESRRTGGGPPPKKPTEATEKILCFLGNTASFSGIDGFESTTAETGKQEK